MKQAIEPEEAIKILLDFPVENLYETLPLESVCGRILGEDFHAIYNMPPFDRSPYDGFALKSEDTTGATLDNPISLRVSGEVRAGDPMSLEVHPGCAVKILTGAVIPTGADCIIKFEEIQQKGEMILISSPVAADSNYIHAGEEYPAGAVLLKAGCRLSPAELAILASQGRRECVVFRRPSVTLITTGSELSVAGTPLLSGKIYDTNRYFVSSYLERLGLNCRSFPPIPDDENQIAEALEDAVRISDVVITTGGASVGDYDYAISAAKKIGARILFWKVRQKPGGAMLAAEVNGKLVLSLSGNPGSAALGLIHVMTPYLRKLCGDSTYAPQMVDVILKDPVKKASPCMRLLRGHLEIHEGKAYIFENRGQGNGMISSLRHFDLLGLIPAGSPPLPAGTHISAYCV